MKAGDKLYCIKDYYGFSDEILFNCGSEYKIFCINNKLLYISFNDIDEFGYLSFYTDSVEYRSHFISSSEHRKKKLENINRF